MLQFQRPITKACRHPPSRRASGCTLCSSLKCVFHALSSYDASSVTFRRQALHLTLASPTLSTSTHACRDILHLSIRSAFFDSLGLFAIPFNGSARMGPIWDARGRSSGIGCALCEDEGTARALGGVITGDVSCATTGFSTHTARRVD